MGIFKIIKENEKKQVKELLILAKKASDLSMKLHDLQTGTNIIDVHIYTLIREYNSTMYIAYQLKKSIGHSANDLTFDDGYSTVRIQSFFDSQKTSIQTLPSHIREKIRLPY